MAGSNKLVGKPGTPGAPDDLGDHEHIFFQAENRHEPLALTDPDGKRHSILRHGGVTINAVQSVVEAVRQGFGIHNGPRWAFHGALQEGDVVEILPGYHLESRPMYAVRAPAVFVPARIRAFMDFTASLVRQVPGLTFR